MAKDMERASAVGNEFGDDNLDSGDEDNADENDDDCKEVVGGGLQLKSLFAFVESRPQESTNEGEDIWLERLSICRI